MLQKAVQNDSLYHEVPLPHPARQEMLPSGKGVTFVVDHCSTMTLASKLLNKNLEQILDLF